MNIGNSSLHTEADSRLPPPLRNGEVPFIVQNNKAGRQSAVPCSVTNPQGLQAIPATTVGPKTYNNSFSPTPAPTGTPIVAEGHLR